jgi:hypothetical protein
MKRKKTIVMSDRQARRKLNWPHAVTGVPAGTKTHGRTRQANEIYGSGGGGIQGAMMQPAWLSRARRKGAGGK